MSDVLEVSGTEVVKATRENILNLEAAIKNLPDSIGEQEAAVIAKSYDDLDKFLKDNEVL